VIRTPSVVAVVAAVAAVGALVLSDVPTSTTRTLIDGCIDHIAYKSAGRCVARLQVELHRRAGARLVPDGQFGEQTLTAVKAYQAQRGLLPDGVVGSGTKERLRLDRPRPDVSVPPGI
jgi:peptidoglycan hydrolase-like protein with peptidoglycan-binding domain